MREFKFRAWDKNDKCMRDWYNLQNHIYGKMKDNIFNDSGYIIMQFTGLYDKNRNEIYEGDILSMEYFSDWIVNWYHYGFHIYNECNPGMQHPLQYTDDREVVGNIYEGRISSDGRATAL